MMEKRLYKSRNNIFIDGVCAGIAKYFGIDPTIVRLLWVIFLFTGTGFVAYIVCAVIVPREPAAIDTKEMAYDPQRRPMD